MQVFLSMGDLDRSIANYRKYKNKAIREIDMCYGLLNNVDSAWNDNNSEGFCEEIKKDHDKALKYFRYLDKFYNLVEGFRDDIQRLISSYGVSNPKWIDYKNDRIQECINSVCDAIGHINNVLDIMNSIVYPSDFNELRLVDFILNCMYSCRKTLRNYANDICNLSNGIIRVVNNNQMKRRSLGNFEERFSNMRYSFRNVYLDDSLELKLDSVAEEKLRFNSNNPNSQTINNIGDLGLNVKLGTATDNAEDSATMNNIGDLGLNVKLGTVTDNAEDNVTMNNIGDLGLNVKLGTVTDNAEDSVTMNNIGDLGFDTEEKQVSNSSFENSTDLLDPFNNEVKESTSTTHDTKIYSKLNYNNKIEEASVSSNNQVMSGSTDSPSMNNISSTSASAVSSNSTSSGNVEMNDVSSVDSSIVNTSKQVSGGLNLSEIEKFDPSAINNN